MTRILTDISVPRSKGGKPGGGLQDWGRKSREDMIASLRRYADHLRARVAAIDATADDEFRITIVMGANLGEHVSTIQEGVQ